MNTVPRKNTVADIMGHTVEYAGRNAVGQHMFKNGTPLVSDIHGTLEEAVERFGKRIDTHEKQYRLSGDWKMGYGSVRYEPRKGARAQEVLEYGLGYIKRLLEKKAAPPVSPVVLTAPLSGWDDAPKTALPEPVDSTPASPLAQNFMASVQQAAKRRGRPPKAR